MALLEVSQLSVAYGDMLALHDVSLSVHEGEIVTVLGANAAGKTTLLRSISGLLHPRRGALYSNGKAITQLAAHQRVAQGLVQVPEGRLVFPFLSVEDNLVLGAFNSRARQQRQQSLAHVYTMFPRLLERKQQQAGSLSGGEQQMLAIGRGLMALPRLLMLDEPSLGLAPLLVQEVMERIARIRDEGVTVLLVEQNVAQSLRVADRGYVLENGRIAFSGSSEELQASDAIRRAYLGL